MINMDLLLLLLADVEQTRKEEAGQGASETMEYHRKVGRQDQHILDEQDGDGPEENGERSESFGSTIMEQHADLSSCTRYMNIKVWEGDRTRNWYLDSEALQFLTDLNFIGEIETWHLTCISFETEPPYLEYTIEKSTGVYHFRQKLDMELPTRYAGLVVTNDLTE